MIVNIEKRTGKVVDVDQIYDERFFENREVPDGTVPKFIDPRKDYRLDVADDTIKDKTNAVPLQPTYKLLMAKEPYGVLHTHPTDQLVIVLAGSVVIAEGKESIVVAAGNSYRIDKGAEHLITGDQDHSLILTVHV